MKKNLIFVLISILFVSCSVEKYWVFEGAAQGTTFRIVYKSSENFDNEINDILKDFDASLSIYNDKSIISRINRNEPNVELDEMFVTFFNKSYEVFKKSDGYFDITVGPLVNAWGFGVDERITADSSNIDSIKAIVGMNKVKIENHHLIKSDPRILLDANAIAQGQSVDYVGEFFEKKGLEDFMIEIGGEVRAKGVNDKGGIWRIGIDKPIEGAGAEDRDLEAIVDLKDKALSTSGNYRKFHEINGIKYAHEIDPKTGFPSRNVLLSASIIADECSIADAFATACMVMGLEKAIKMLEQNKDIDAYFIYSGQNGQYLIYQTEGFKKYLSIE